ACQRMCRSPDSSTSESGVEATAESPTSTIQPGASVKTRHRGPNGPRPLARRISLLETAKPDAKVQEPASEAWLPGSPRVAGCHIRLQRVSYVQLERWGDSALNQTI